MKYTPEELKEAEKELEEMFRNEAVEKLRTTIETTIRSRDGRVLVPVVLRPWYSP